MRQIDLTQLKADKAAGKFSKIGSVATLNNQLNQIYKTLSDKLEGYTVFYRGHSDIDFSPIPSIYRENPLTGHKFVNEEEKFCSGIIRECPAEFEKTATAFDMLVKMQHYELPTRLLDITENPLVALYFACQEPPLTKGNNGEILIYFIHNEDLTNYSDLQVNALSSISFIKAELLKNARTKSQINNMLHNMKVYTSHLPFIETINDLDKTLCVLPKKTNPRITRQQGAFFLFGIKNGDKAEMSNIDIEPFTLTINNDERTNILNHLERYAITEKFLFPEIDNVAHYIKTH